MTHSLLQLLFTQPSLLGDHAEAYADLIGAELALASADLQHQTRLRAAALACWSVGVVLGGVALMLWWGIPTVSMRAPWVLIVVPVLPLVAALGCHLRLSTAPHTRPFAQLRLQFATDMALLRERVAP